MARGFSSASSVESSSSSSSEENASKQLNSKQFQSDQLSSDPVAGELSRQVSNEHAQPGKEKPELFASFDGKKDIFGGKEP